MEPVTQGLLGAAVGELAAGRTLGRRALFWGALIGMSPDLDVVLAPLHEGFGEWIYHRGTTHALWFGFVAGPAIAALLWRWQDPEGRTPYRAWAALAIAALVTHPLLDGFTPYGTQLAAPFWRERFVWNGVAIVDPIYSLLLGLGVWIAASKTRSDRARRRGLVCCLLLSMLYLAVGVGLARWVESDVRRALEGEGLGPGRVTAYPTVLQPWLRHLVAHDGDQVYVGLHSLARPGCPSWRVRSAPSSESRARAILETWQGETLAWFADGELGVEETRRDPLGSVLRIDDLRYTWGSASGRGMWGLEARFDREGALRGRVRRFGRANPSERDFDVFFSALLGELPGSEQGWTRPERCR
jgi:inner membrane protein